VCVFTTFLFGISNVRKRHIEREFPMGATTVSEPSAIRRIGAFVVCLLWLLCQGSSAGAQEAAPTLSPKEVMPHSFINPPHDARPARAMIRDRARTREAAPELNTKEVVLHHFSSPRHGAYPAAGVIRDFEGNLYGTTNGSYSDIGGGGTHDAGVVFKIDPWGTETVLYTFKGGADGSSPNGLVRDSAGNLYGTTSYGGTSGAGVVFELDTSGNETVLYSFTGGIDGGNPNSLIRDWKGNLFGTTASGGASDYGVVFKIDPSGKETVLYPFEGGADGAYPNQVVALDRAGNFYGATGYGGNAVGTSGAGVVFKVDTAGHETVLYTFTGGSDGAQPNGVIRDSKGDLYGTTSDGGASGAGVVFKVDAAGHETVLYTFTGGNDGGSPYAGVIPDSRGNLYGTTAFGGVQARGVVFKVEPTGRETVLHTFTRGTDGTQPYTAGVIFDPAGNLYGTTSFGGVGGAGTVYKLDTRDVLTVLYGFSGAAKGQYPYNGRVILGSDGHLYGTTFYGGDRGYGVVYQLHGDRDERVLYTFNLLTANGFGQPGGDLICDSAGNIYGTTFGGPLNAAAQSSGVVYKLDVAGHAAILHNFTGGADGASPYGGVILDGTGNVYGTASGGGASNNGVVFKIDPSGDETVLHSFTGGADGGGPYGSLIRDSAGNFYGTTNGGGVSGAGVVFKLDPSGHETVLYSFTGGDDGGYPLAGLVRDSAGNFYGTTNGGGASGAGVVFKIDAARRETVLYSFTGEADGGSPLWVTLARDSSGNLYGTTVAGGAANAGVVFKLDSSGHETVLHSFTGGDDGGNPYVGVILGQEGQLYGTTAFGGRENVGVVFAIEPK
jgi:uncharacterized repeat protein (TIGR03803 family)